MQEWEELLGRDGRASVLGFTLATLIALLFTDPVRRLAERVGAIDRPGGRRIHRQPTARLGGLAVCLALTAAAALVLWLDLELRNSPSRVTALTILICSGLVCGLGVVDDLRGLRPRSKLLGLVAVAGIAVAAGIRIDNVTVPGFGTVPLSWCAVPVTLVWLVGCANAINLIDGVDGGSSGVVMASSLVLTAVALGIGDAIPAVVFAATAGACAGFLFHNRHPARIFLGDSGSLTLGFVLAATAASCCAKRATAVMIGAALLALAVPLFDTTHSIVRTVPGGVRVMDLVGPAACDPRDGRGGSGSHAPSTARSGLHAPTSRPGDDLDHYDDGSVRTPVAADLPDRTDLALAVRCSGRGPAAAHRLAAGAVESGRPWAHRATGAVAAARRTTSTPSAARGTSRRRRPASIRPRHENPTTVGAARSQCDESTASHSRFRTR